ncbi:DUF1707 SHOCT-like domain-containing protein [Nocardia sp. NBC_01327]|uniref:DUF1707 SHOCT-like domain-containing protein n=1 Tax=Nocardia sp. NBC_01327 TaxID=2903593 RepID=UPI002E13D4D3|nr:DUF1707 domain-containing protein [Nocardia sp. NBC_01327]
MDITAGTRASDAERAQVADALGRHMAEGRLDVTEYNERLGRVYGTATIEDLRPLLSDLPPLTIKPAAPHTARIPIWQRIEGSAWLGVSVLCLFIWAAISFGTGEFTYPWPLWVIGPWGAVLVFRVLTGWEAGALNPHHHRRHHVR